MTRPAIFLTLIAATLIGPLLCCCTLVRAFAPASPTQITRTEQAASHEPACPNCRAAAHGPGANLPQPVAPTEPVQSCPCCAERATTVSVAPDLRSPLPPALLLVAILPSVADALPLPIPAATLTDHPPGRGTTAFLLDSCHRLRC